jgi:peroxiredoxin
LVDYRQHYPQIRATGASVVAVSVDAPDKSEALRHGLGLPFPILCDTQRHVIREWDIYNPRERGGIAKPAVFVVERDRSVGFASVDGVATRVPAPEIVRILQAVGEGQPVRRAVYVPRLGEWFRAIRNLRR